ncbi:c-type cytochrome [Flavobacterium cheniae]|jgi:nitric oxide reductase subunit C|uniref:Nitric oxide reductase subunit C n=1 Tax=Flavobacterium cheniae TaxID=295428 RepID=A0A562KS52_9FLAO|nr:cytochrome c [Flavobacterium cheniae]TDR25619.1 nitric oxide reductase subunit C [Flavobacterium cheniae]TWH98194.1 nitric oxide reductase subunit C [Flavobacterium cheniae]
MLNLFAHPKHIFFVLFVCFIAFSVWIYTIPLFSPSQYSEKELHLVAEGRLVWQKYNCHTCHQLYGLGGYLGPDLTNVYSRSGNNEHYIRGIVKSGVKQMPAFEISEDEMKVLLLFLKNVDQSGTSNPQDYQPEILGTFSLEKK